MCAAPSWNLNCISDKPTLTVKLIPSSYALDFRMTGDWASYMEASGNQNVDLNSQFGTIVATHPHLQLSRNSIPSPPLVVHPCPSFARFCESRISSSIFESKLYNNLRFSTPKPCKLQDCLKQFKEFH